MKVLDLNALNSFFQKIKTKFAPIVHTHPYAGSNASGGAATSANKLSVAREIAIGASSKTFDGASNVSWTLSEIGASGITVERSVNIPPSAWTGNAAPYVSVINVDGVTPTSNGTIGLAINATAAQREAARNAIISMSAQGTGTITLVSDGDKPTIAIPSTIYICG